MKKRFDRYFGNNIGRKFYIASLAFIVIGVIIGYAYWWGYGMPLMVLGVIGFLVSSGIQVSDKDVDEHIQNTLETYKEKLNGRAFGKETLDSRDFSYFYGFIREDAHTRFVSGRDGKVRTSKYYITAISAKPHNAKVFTVTYDLLSNENEPNDSFISTNGAHSLELASENLEFPAGNKKCTLTVGTETTQNETFTFYVPNDALADKLLDTIAKK